MSSEFVVDVSAEGGVDGASSPINWLTVTLMTGDALNRSVPCRELGGGGRERGEGKYLPTRRPTVCYKLSGPLYPTLF